MKRSWIIGAAVAACAVFASNPLARGQASGLGDSIRTHSDGPIHGNVESATRNELSITQKGVNKTIPVDDLEAIKFADEPHEMQVARVDADKGNYAGALREIEKLKPDDLPRELLRTELEYLKIVFKVKLAISSDAEGDDDSSSDSSPADLVKNPNSAANEAIEMANKNPVDLAKKVGPELVEFLKVHPNTFHYYEGNELAGDLLVWLGNVEQAPSRFAAASMFYEKLATSPWPDFQARARLLQARQLQLQGKYDEALKAYDAVLAVQAKGQLAGQQMQEATIGRTYCLVGTNHAQDALKILQDTIAKADDDDTTLLARAYCALGNCYRALKDSKQALWAYLRVDVQYPSIAESHAEALANLEVLWNEMHRPDRARDAHDYLASHYPYSRWSKRSVAH
ncbi:MAG TPA: hypothetical protein VHX65_18480 [Pirellulales bacterium]|nr:hypothetical protein [Pirellulales bacterium]